MKTGIETIVKALIVNYESLYDIDMETGWYSCFCSNGSGERFMLKRQGNSFFADLPALITQAVAPEDQAYVEGMLEREALLAGTKHGEYYSFIYRGGRNGQMIYYKIRAKREMVEGSNHIYLGVRDVDHLIRRERKHTEELQRRVREKEELERQLQLSRIRNFTGQMHPHFLYNALGSIQEIMLEDPEYASELLGDFTTYLRGCIRSMNGDDAVPFSQELENIRAYVNIEKMRFGEKLKVIYEIEAPDFPVLPLSIQPLVENAIRHGVYQRGKAGGTVVIRTRRTDGFYEAEVEDDGIGFDYEKYRKAMDSGKMESAGLRNLTFRLEKVLGAEIIVKSASGSGTVVTVRIPDKKGGDSNENDHRG